MHTGRKSILECSLRLEGLATYLQGIREQERAHLARELHDELGALLTGAKLDMACLKSRLGGKSPEIDLHLQHLGDALSRAIALKSSIVEGLCPSALANLGLVPSLDILVREFQASSGIGMTTDFGKVDAGESTRLAVYRLVQESLTNIAKYAAASRAQVTLHKRGAGIMVTVRDNGIGFDLDRIGMSSHGLAGMRHRIEACGGHLRVDSSPGKGTRIVAIMPPEPGQPEHPAPAATSRAGMAGMPAFPLGDLVVTDSRISVRAAACSRATRATRDGERVASNADRH